MVGPSTPAHVPFDLNTTLVSGGSSYGGPRKRAQKVSVDMLFGAHNLFDGMPRPTNFFMQSIIFDGDEAAIGSATTTTAGYDPEETQSQDGRGGLFMSSTYDQVGMQPTFMQDQAGLDLDVFAFDHMFLDDYGLEEEYEVDINGEPLFKDELDNQDTGMQPKRKRRWMRAYTEVEDKLLCECWRDIGQDPKVSAKQKASIFWIRVHREFMNSRSFRRTKCKACADGFPFQSDGG
ncbi:DNA repair protein rhp54 [Hordeum vulgare]|nr:DNA repair protein rhp54 [Hordeum vulgare]